MKRIIMPALLFLSGIFFIACNDAANGKANPDTTVRQADTIETPIIREGGIKDSLRIGASDSSAVKKDD